MIAKLPLVTLLLLLLVGSGSATDDKASSKSPPAEKNASAARPEDKNREGSGGRTPVPDRSSSKAAKAKGEINFDDLKFDIVKDQAFAETMLNEDVLALDGKKVKLRGYILPATLYKEKGIGQFVLVRDNQECCFGPGAALFDAVMIEMEPGKTTDFVTRPVTVEGKFEIDVNKYRYPGGVGPRGATHLAIFRIRGINVK